MPPSARESMGLVTVVAVGALLLLGICGGLRARSGGSGSISDAGGIESLPLSNSSGRTVLQWCPVEWSVPNPTFRGNPFDLKATVTFVHPASGETRTTGMFYAGGDTWKFRFTGTRPGRWTFTTRSTDADLDGRRGTVLVRPNPEAYGFVTHIGNRWARQRGVDGHLEAFVPHS